MKVRIGFDQLDARILPDMGVKVAFLAGAEGAAASETLRVVRVPRAALRQEGGQRRGVRGQGRTSSSAGR